MPAKSLTIKAYAKVNLYLRVLRKRPDGYHELDTLFERVSLHDTLEIRAGRGVSLSCSDRSLEGPGNLVARAAELLRARHGAERGAHLRLVKRIPVAGGMGGGSSDGAAALLGLNRFWGLKLSKQKLLEYALELGSDVPFFILESPVAAGQGRGEKLRAIRPHKKLWHVLAFSDLKVPTKEIFMALKPADFDPKKVSPAGAFAALAKGDGRPLVNSLERALFDRHPELADLKNGFLGEGAYAALTSGSGPTQFALAKSKASAETLARRMRKRFNRARFFVVSTA